MSSSSHIRPANSPSAGTTAAVPLIILALPALAVLLSGCEQESPGSSAPTTIHVKVATPLERDDVVPYEYVRGTTKATRSVDIYCRVSGYLKKIDFVDGDIVAKDKLLFQIDDAPFKAAYDKAEADVKLAAANREFRTAELERNKSLPPGAISKSELDKSIAALDEAKATEEAAQATREKAKEDLGYTKVLAPIGGRMSKAAITEGNLVVADKTLLSSLASEDEMYVEYNIDEQIFNDVQKQIREGRIKITEKQSIPVAVKLSNDNDYIHEGQLNFVDNAFKTNTGTILFRAKFHNPRPATGMPVLWPGMSVEVRMPIGVPGKAMLIAERAIGADLDQKYVYILNAKNQPEKRMVKLGTTFEGLQVVEEGLKPSDEVIVVGQQNALRPNVTIEKETVKMADYGTASVPEAATAPAKSSADAAALPARAGKEGRMTSCFPDSSSTGRFSPRCSRSCSWSPARWPCSCFRWRNTRRSPRPRCRSPASTPAPVPRSSPTRSPRPSSSRSTAWSTCSTCRRNAPTTAPTTSP